MLTREQLSDTLLSILAVRGGEIVQSVFGGAQHVDARAEGRANGRGDANGTAHANGVNGFS